MAADCDDRTSDELLGDPVVRRALERIASRPPRCPRCWRGTINRNSRHGFCQPCEREHDERIRESKRRSYRRRGRLPTTPETEGTNLDGSGINEGRIEVVAADGSPFLRIEEAARVLRIARSTLYDWVGRGVIKAIKIGGTRYITSDEIIRVLERAERDQAGTE